MAKSHTAVWASDAPTPAQFKELFAQIDNGRVTKDRLQAFLRGEDLAGEIFPVVIDYTKSLADMIAAGHYDWVNNDITQEHFPITGEGKVESELVLVHLNRPASTEEALKELESRGLRPAMIEELLAFGAKFSDKQREFPIIALCAVWARPVGHRDVAYLSEDVSRRRLHLHWCEGGWHGSCRFLAFRK